MSGSTGSQSPTRRWKFRQPFSLEGIQMMNEDRSPHFPDPSHSPPVRRRKFRQPFSLEGVRMMDEYRTPGFSAPLAPTPAMQSTHAETDVDNPDDTGNEMSQHGNQYPPEEGSSDSPSTTAPAGIPGKRATRPDSLPEIRGAEPSIEWSIVPHETEVEEDERQQATEVEPSNERPTVLHNVEAKEEDARQAQTEDRLLNERLDTLHITKAKEEDVRQQETEVEPSNEESVVPHNTEAEGEDARQAQTEVQLSIEQLAILHNTEAEEEDVKQQEVEVQQPSGEPAVPHETGAEAKDERKSQTEPAGQSSPENEEALIDPRPETPSSSHHPAGEFDRSSIDIFEVAREIRKILVGVTRFYSFEKGPYDNARFYRLKRDVTLIADIFYSWQQRWMVWEDARNLFHLLWDGKSTGVEICIATVLEDCRTLQMVLDKIGRSSRNPPKAKVNRDAEFPQLDRTPSRMYKVLDKMNYSLRNPMFDFINTWLNKHRRYPLLDRTLSRIYTDLEKLNMAADDAFLRVADRDPMLSGTRPETLRIHQLCHSRQLVGLAMSTWETSNALQICEPQALSALGTVELDLDMFNVAASNPRMPTMGLSGHTSNRTEAIAIYATRESLHYTFITRLSAEPDSKLFRFCVVPNEGNSDMTQRGEDFADAIRYIHKKGSNSQFRILDKKELVLRKMEDNLEEWGCSEPLRKVLSTDPDPSQDTFAIIRAKRAFLLAEFGLLFFKTKWLRLVCSCNILQRWTTAFMEGITADTYQFTFNCVSTENEGKSLVPKSAPAPQTSSAELAGQTCWCAAKSLLNDDDRNLSRFAAFPLFFLGLVLIEIALTTPLVRVTVEGNITSLDKIKLTYRNDSSETGTLRTDTAQKYLELDMPEAAFYDAIIFCLTSKLDAETAREDEIREYYWKVVAPLDRTYRRLVQEDGMRI
ncbi:hypothetical protein F4678DRAFT_346878 [Xylaria arbuscula]|nr:hypothetical protein F4678DRAFT_346878 [Xylaria arbuscula]